MRYLTGGCHSFLLCAARIIAWHHTLQDLCTNVGDGGIYGLPSVSKLSISIPVKKKLSKLTGQEYAVCRTEGHSLHTCWAVSALLDSTTLFKKVKKETYTNTWYYKLLKLQLKYKVHKLHQRMYLVITRMPAESHRRPLGPLLLCLYDVSRTLINSLVCWIDELVLGFQKTHQPILVASGLVSSVHIP